MKKKQRAAKQTAVALRYNESKDKAPKVTAKGKGSIAERIIALARENKIPIKADPDLVEVLSKIDINKEVPPSVYKVVAELLAFVYKVNSNYKTKKL